MTHAPARREARPGRCPVFIWYRAGTWSFDSVKQRLDERDVVDVLGDVRVHLADPRPALAVLLELERRLHQRAGVAVEDVDRRSSCRAFLSSSGLGSNRSTALGPPSMNSQMTDLAFAAKCGGFGASGSPGGGSSSAAERGRAEQVGQREQPQPRPGPRQELAGGVAGQRRNAAAALDAGQST